GGLATLSQTWPDGRYAAGYNPSGGQPGMSIFLQWWYAVKKSLWGGGMTPGEAYVGRVNFSDTAIDGNDYLDETTYNMFLHVFEGPSASVAQRFTGSYFGGDRDRVVFHSHNERIT